MLSQKRFEELVEWSEGRSLSTFWVYLKNDVVDFSARTEIFLWILERLLKEGRIKLHRKGVFLESSIEEQVEAFRAAWPESVEASGYEDFYWWFFDDACPGSVAWRTPEGRYQIAD